MLLSQPILFFGGKGGVGKTTLAASTALAASERGQRTLLVSTDPAHSTGDILGMAVGADIAEVAPCLWALEIDPAREADRYIDEVKAHILESAPPRLVAEVERQIDIARVTPGAEEAALFERFTRIMEDLESRYDRIVFDTAPLGHTLRLLSLPELMATWMSGLVARRRKVGALSRMWRTVAGAVGGGVRAEDDPALQTLEDRVARFERARRTITDAERAAFVFVIVPEQLPIIETARALGVLERYRIAVGGVIVNRVLPATADGTFLARRREREHDLLLEIEHTFARYPIAWVPLFETDVCGVESLRRVAVNLVNRSTDS